MCPEQKLRRKSLFIRTLTGKKSAGVEKTTSYVLRGLFSSTTKFLKFSTLILLLLGLSARILDGIIQNAFYYESRASIEATKNIFSDIEQKNICWCCRKSIVGVQMIILFGTKLLKKILNYFQFLSFAEEKKNRVVLLKLHSFYCVQYKIFKKKLFFCNSSKKFRLAF